MRKEEKQGKHRKKKAYLIIEKLNDALGSFP